MKSPIRISKTMLEIMVFAAQAGFNGWITADDVRATNIKVVNLNKAFDNLVKKGDLSYRSTKPPEYCLTPDGIRHMMHELKRLEKGSGFRT